MEELKKIIAKATYGQGIKSFSKDIHIKTMERKRPAEILGLIVTNAAISESYLEETAEGGKAVRIKGSFDAHLWYALNGDTKVVKAGRKFSDLVTVNGPEGEEYTNEEVRTWIHGIPQCTGTSVVDSAEGSGVTATVEYELGAEIVGQTTLNVKVISTVDFSDDAGEIPEENREAPDEYEDD